MNVGAIQNSKWHVWINKKVEWHVR